MAREELSTDSIAPCPHHPAKDLFEQTKFPRNLERLCRTWDIRDSLGLWVSGRKIGSVFWHQSWEAQLFSRKEEQLALWISTRDNEMREQVLRNFVLKVFWISAIYSKTFLPTSRRQLVWTLFVITWSLKAVHEAKSLPVLLEIMALGRNPKQG